LLKITDTITIKGEILEDRIEDREIRPMEMADPRLKKIRRRRKKEREKGRKKESK
jgi:hypothetical protein